MHDSFDICTYRCDPFRRLDKFALLQFLLSLIFVAIMFFSLLFNNIIHIEMKVWRKETERAQGRTVKTDKGCFEQEGRKSSAGVELGF